MKNILFFTHSLNSGGAEKNMRILGKYINSHCENYKAYICVIHDDSSCHNEVDNLLVLPHSSKEGDSIATKVLNVLGQIRDLKKVKKTYNIDTCISFLPCSDILNVLSYTGEKEIVSVRAQESRFAQKFFKKLYVKYTYHKCDSIVTVSNYVKQDCIDYFKAPEDKITTIYNPISNANVNSDLFPEVHEFVRGKKIILHVGRLSVEKGQQHILRAFSEYLKGNENSGLVILGDGPERENLENLSDRLGISSNVFFAGKVDNPRAYMEFADVLILASYYEGMTNVLLEAMQTGVPCISTDCGAREILAPNTYIKKITKELEKAQYGIIVPVCKNPDYNRIDADREEKIMTEAFRIILNDSDLSNHYSECAKDYVARYAIEPIIQQWIDIINK